jgi:hypothetical protein
MNDKSTADKKNTGEVGECACSGACVGCADRDESQTPPRANLNPASTRAYAPPSSDANEATWSI